MLRYLARLFSASAYEKRERSVPVSEMASEIAGAIRTLAGSICYLAACASEDDLTQGEVRERAALYYRTSELEFGGVKHEGAPITQLTIDQCDALLSRVRKGKR